MSWLLQIGNIAVDGILSNDKRRLCPSPFPSSFNTNYLEHTLLRNPGSTIWPTLKTNHSSMGQNVSTANTHSPRIFLSHAGEDKETIARPLWRRLTNLGLSVFLDEESFRLGDHCPKVMEHAMQTAPVGLFIMSPEFVAKQWPMRELLAFVSRYDRAIAAKETPPLLISIFYRFTTRQCRDPTIFRTHGELFDRHGLFKRAIEGTISLKAVWHALNMSATLWSIENDLGATNSHRPNMASTRQCFLDIIHNRISELLGVEGAEVVDTRHLTVGNQPVEKDVYTPCNMVPPNPPRLTLDYGSPATCEGRLKIAVLCKSRSRIVAVVATGKGGVGKTCALRGLAEDAEVRRMFPGGILYIELGYDATISSIVEGIADIVHGTGGSSIANVIRAGNSVVGASEKASKWFGPHSCLFLVDDIWHVNGIDSDVLTTLGQMVNANSRMVYTTRDRYFLGEVEETLEFKEKETFGGLSRQMLMTHAGFELNTALDGKNKVAFDYFLALCQGLPLGFGIVGSSVQRYALDCVRKQDAWSEFYNDVLSQRKDLIDTAARAYGELPRIVNSSLQVLKKRSGHEKFGYWFRALSVIQKQQSVPVQMLQKLWDLDTLQEAQTVVEAFADVSVLQMTRNTGSVSVVLHDLILDIADRRSTEESETEAFFRTLLSNYILSDNRKETHEAASSTGLCHAWWDDEDDGYLHNNLCRMLQNAGYVDQLFWLLTQPQWIVQRLLKGGVLSIEKDLNLGKEVCEDPTLYEHLHMIGQAVRLSASFVSNNPCMEEAWFQLHGRLLWHLTQNELTSDFVQRMEGSAPKPWLKASAGLLQQADGSVLQVFSVRGAVLCTREESDAVWILSRGPHEDVIHVGRHERSNEHYKQERLEGTRKTKRWMGKLQCASFSYDGRTVVTAHGDEVKDWWMQVWNLVCNWQTGVVFVWNRQTGVCQHAVPHICPHHRKFVKFVSDGAQLACQRHDNSIQLWETVSGKPVGRPFPSHADWERYQPLMAEATQLVSCFRDDMLRVWDAEHGHDWGQTLEGRAHTVKHVAVSADGTRIASGFDDDTVIVWDAQTGEIVAMPFLHEADMVRCVAVSANGTHVVAGDAKLLQLWDLDCTHVGREERSDTTSSDAEVPRLFREMKEPLKCVLTSRDAAWQGTIEKLDLTWSTPFWRPLRREVCDTAEDGSEVVLGSCEEYVANVNGGDVYFTRDFRSCRIVR